MSLTKKVIAFPVLVISYVVKFLAALVNMMRFLPYVVEIGLVGAILWLLGVGEFFINLGNFSLIGWLNSLIDGGLAIVVGTFMTGGGLLAVLLLFGALFMIGQVVVTAFSGVIRAVSGPIDALGDWFYEKSVKIAEEPINGDAVRKAVSIVKIILSTACLFGMLVYWIISFPMIYTGRSFFEFLFNMQFWPLIGNILLYLVVFGIIALCVWVLFTDYEGALEETEAAYSKHVS